MGDIKEKAIDLFEAAAEQVPDVLSSIVLEGIVGSVVPGVTGAMLAYKQKRQEHMFTLFLEEIRGRVDELAVRLEAIEPDKYEEIKSKYFGLVSDYVLDEVQEEKIHFIVNGFSNLAFAESVSEDFVLTYYDTLQSLRMVDIAALKRQYDITFMHGKPLHYYDFCRKVGIDDDQYRAVMAKLERVGLVTTRRAQNEAKLYQNIEIIQKYLEKVEKERKAGSKSNFTLDRFNTMDKDTYTMSHYGTDFVRFFLMQ